jgi:bifunctional UDP-N-acetylglucosamine pyrophosphorylase / glucosamine-1-phosphate N-acetyltransferase
MKITAVVMAAGQGIRMKSRMPKILHPLMGRPMAFYSLEAARKATGETPVAVIGFGADDVQNVLGDAARYVVQEQQLGTGHAVQQVASLLRGKADLILVTAADMPLLTFQTLEQLIQAQQAHSGPLTLLTATSADSHGFGRILREPDGQVSSIIEEAHATPEQRSIRELNAGIYCFAADWLWQALPRIPLSPKGEYYLTDLVGIAVEDGLSVQAIPVQDPAEVIGINTRVHLAEAEGVLRQRINREWMLAGVTIIDPANTFIEPGVTIGQDTTIWPDTYLEGSTRVGENCTLGPNTILRDTQLGDNCTVLASVLEGALVEDDVEIGPFGHLRKGAHLGRGVHMGNFGEVKNSYLGSGTKMGHFSYVGDTTTGTDVNIGAGTITCNYDGRKKHHTDIGSDAFIGSDTMLVAPVKVGERARTGAGAVVTKDVPSDTLAVGVPARAIRKLERRD